MGTVQMLRSAGAMETAAEPTDLIAAAAGGDLGAFERLYRQYSPRVYGLCLRLTGQREAAEDCTQESFVAAWRALAGFEQRSRFATWLHRIAVYTVLARRRGLRAEYEVAEPATGLPEVADPGSEAPPLDVERAIARLPEGARHVLCVGASMVSVTPRRPRHWGSPKAPARRNCIVRAPLLSASS